MPVLTGPIEKMRSQAAAPVEYFLPLGESELPLTARVGERLVLRHTGRIFCTHCGRKTNKSFAQGYCYPCFTSLAQCDSCIVKPELCHYAAGTCREPEWGEQNCFIPHVVYLANSSGLKVGITRHSQVPTRWIDQGATQALPVLRVASRKLSGLVEVMFKDHVADKTDWRAMLKGEAIPLDLPAERERLLAAIREPLAALREQEGEGAVVAVDETPLQLQYPVRRYPLKVASLDFDKQAEINATLEGIKGQYLIFDTGVINMRKFGGYELTVEAS